MTVYLFSFSFGVINVVDYFLCLYNFTRSLVALISPKSERWRYFAFWILPPVRFRVS